MIETTIKAVLGITVVICGWLSVQMVWRRVFANSIDGTDPLVDRCGCHSCCQSMCDEAAVDEEDAAGKGQQGAHQFNQEG